MKVTGLIVEYNPFHNGHKYHLEKSMEISGGNLSIAVMSGNWLQRGEPAVLNKWLRAKMAVENGVDIVVELPSFYSNQSAEIFSEGAVRIAHALRCDNIVFGSESGSIEELTHLAQIQLDKEHEFHNILKNHLEKGLSYPNAINNAYEDVTGKSGILNPNNILGIEYIKALMKMGSNTKPLTIKREKVGYHEERAKDKIASATSIRKMLMDGRHKEVQDVVPEKTYEILMANLDKLTDLKDFYPLIRHSLIVDRDRLQGIQDMEEGLWNRLYSVAREEESFDSFLERVMNKRYTYSRIKRVLTHVLLGIYTEEVEEGRSKLPYIRVLAYNPKGAKYMKSLKKDYDLGYIISLKNAEKIVEDKSFLDREIDRDLVYKMQYPYIDEKFAIIVKDK